RNIIKAIWFSYKTFIKWHPILKRLGPWTKSQAPSLLLPRKIQFHPKILLKSLFRWDIIFFSLCLQEAILLLNCVYIGLTLILISKKGESVCRRNILPISIRLISFQKRNARS